jgi:hypothetical protein
MLIDVKQTRKYEMKKNPDIRDDSGRDIASVVQLFFFPLSETAPIDIKHPL